MLILSGTLLVLLCWSVAAVAVVSLGLLPALASDRRGARPAVMASALWWGLAILAVAVSVIGAAVPLRSTGAELAVLALVLLLGIPGWLLLRRRSPGTVRIAGSWRWVVGVLAAAQVYLAIAALGPVTGYDTGLYHLGAIAYAGDFATMPGLANLYGPLGYATAQFPLGAVLGNSPLGSEGFRLLNGLLMGLAALDLILRLRCPPTVGRYVLLVGITAAWVPMLAMSDFWVTSPSQDSAVLILTVVAAAYLADAIAGGRYWVRDVSTVGALAVLLVLMRSTMLVFALAALAMVVLVAIRRRRSAPRDRLVVSAVLLGCLALVGGFAALLRDYLLSGWVLFPLSVHAFDVPWLAPDPTLLREATLGFHRNRADIWHSVTGWDWVGRWFGRLPSQWESYEIVALAVAALVLVWLAARATRGRFRWRALALTMLPSAVASAVWWLATPPAFRFAWGPLFTLFAIPIGWSLWQLARRHDSAGRLWRQLAVAGLGVPIIAVLGVCITIRFDWNSIDVDRQGWGVPYAVAAIPKAEVERRVLPDGLMIGVPVVADQCWATYPMCTPHPVETLRLRGGTLADGFLP
jgi:hypothetical protein